MPKALRYLFIGILLLLFLILIALWLGTPPIARHYLTQFFHQQNAHFSADTIRLNPLFSELEIRDVQITQEGTPVFTADQLKIRVRLTDLLDHRIHLSRILFSGLELDLSQEENRWRVAGILIEPETSEDIPESSPGEPWTITIPEARIEDSRIRLTRGAGSDELYIRDFELVNFDLNWPGILGKVDFEGNLNQAPLIIRGNVSSRNGAVEAFTDLALTELSVERLMDFLPAELAGSSAALSLKTTAQLYWDGENLSVEMANTDTSLADLQILHAPYRVDSTLLRILLPEFSLVLNEGELEELRTSYRIESSLTQVFHRNQDEEQLITGWQSLETQGGKYDLTAATPLLLPEAQITDLTFSRVHNEQEALPALAHAGQLRVQNLALEDSHLHIDLIALQELDVNLVLSPQRDPANLVSFSSESAENNAQPAAEDSSTTEPGTSFSLGRLDISGTSTLTLIDRSVKPEVMRSLILESFHVDRLDTRQPEQASPFQFRATMDTYSSIQTEGTVHPFSDALNLNLTTTLRELDLPPLSPYLRNALSYDFESGQLDLNLNVAIQDGAIEGQTRIVLRGADLRPLEKKDRAAEANPTLIPLNAALNMIENDQGNVELDIPLSGSTDNPDFSIRGFIARTLGKAIMQAASTYAVQAFVPYASVITVAQIAGEQMLKIRFKPLELQPGQLPGSAQQEFIQQFGKLLTEKEDLQVKICGFATPSDLDLQEQELTEAQQQQLQALAGQRASVFKQLVIDQTQVSSARLLTCNAGIDRRENAQPRIEFGT